MITKWATSIANKLAELSGEDVSADKERVGPRGDLTDMVKR